MLFADVERFKSAHRVFVDVFVRALIRSTCVIPGFFSVAIKLKPDHATARANYKSLAQEIERLGALIAVAGKPSFYCKTARRAVEKAICANRELADLDREIHAMNVRVIRDQKNIDDARALQREQEAFIARRNAEFGRPGYDLRKALKDRLRELVGADGY